MYFLRHLGKVIQLFQLIQEFAKLVFKLSLMGLSIGVDNCGTKQNCIPRSPCDFCLLNEATFILQFIA